jgi:acyl-CoA synthetase (AMP-forming)/AMP-acid ligase II/NADP-dependent 3-hydroxy acid dehydrogenase YdfG/acyl carrier protein
MATEIRLPPDATQLSAAHLERALRRYPAVHDVAVLRRRDDDDIERTVAYVVPGDCAAGLPAAANFSAVLPPSQLPDEFVFVTALPLDPDGRVSDERLRSIEVLDDAVLDHWSSAARQTTGVAQVCVDRIRRDDSIGSVHRMELLPSASPPPAGGSLMQAQPAPPNSTLPGDAPLALVHGASLEWPGQGPTTLAESLERAARLHPDKGVHFIGADGQRDFCSYSQLMADAEQACAGLAAMGLAPGDRVMFQLRENREFIAAFWGCVLGGLVPVPLSVASAYSASSAAVQKLANAWAMLGEPLVLASAEIVAPLSAAMAELGARGARVAAFADLGHRAATARQTIRPDDLTLLLLTSGSTGTPKAVMHTHRTLLNRSAASVAFNGFDAGNISLNWMPLDHVGGIVYFHLRDVFLGCNQIHVAMDWILSDPLRWLDLIDEYRVSTTWAPNFAYALTAERVAAVTDRDWDLSCLRFLFNGGEAVVARTARRFLTLLAPHGLRGDCMHPAWGMSETASGITYSRSFSLETTTDDAACVEVGGPLPNTSLRIVDGDNQVLPEGELGRLQVQGASITPGYFRNPEMNEKSFTPDGWFDTGDIGFLRNGILTVTGRAKDDVIINGVNYLPAEIEAVTDAVDGVYVAYSAACAVRGAGSETDELAIFFCPVDNTDKALARVLGAIRDAVSATVGISPACLVPLARSDVPKTAIGKIQRAELRRRFEAGQFEAQRRRADLLSRTNAVPEWFYRKVWQPKAARTRIAPAELGAITLFSDSHGIGAALHARLQAAGAQCVLVEMGADFARPGRQHFRMDPADPGHYQRLLAMLREQGTPVRRIVHLWSCDPDDPAIASVADLRQSQQHGACSVLRLVQALAGAADAGDGIELLVASTGTQATSDADRPSCRHSAVLGLMKTIPQEFAAMRCRHVDLEREAPATSAAHVLEELCSPGADDEIAYRGGQRFGWDLAPIDMRKAPRGPVPIVPGGIYLLAGGLGGIGSVVAAALLRDYRARLLLVGTTPIPQGAERQAALARGGRTADRIRQLMELESRGEVLYRQADVADEAALRSAVADAESRWGASLAGVFHLAASADVAAAWRDGGRFQLATVTTESFDAMFQAKVYGTWALYRILRERPAALMVNFGSILGIFGAARFGAYAAAHTFLRNFVIAQRCDWHAPSYSIAWSAWYDTGLSKAEPAAARDLYSALGYFVIDPRQGLDSLLGVLCRDLADVIVGVDGANPNIARHVPREARGLQRAVAFFTAGGEDSEVQSLLSKLSVRDRFGTKSCCEFVRVARMPVTATGDIDREALHMAAAAADGRTVAGPRNEVERQIAAIWGEVLGRRAGIHESFFRLGGNSLRASQVMARISREFGIRLDMRDLFEHTTIAKLAALLEQRRAAEMATEAGRTDESLNPEALLQDLHQLSDAQVAELLQRLHAEGQDA